MNMFFKTKKTNLFFFLLLIVFTLASFWRVLTFGMWVDDSHLMWASLYDISTSYWYYNHPGLPLEFLLLSHLFGTKYILWQIVNILLKAAVAFCAGLFLFKLTKNKSVGLLGSLFFAVSYVGLEVVDAPIMNIAGIVAIPILLSLNYFIDVIQKQKNTKKSILFLLLALFLDPGRVFSVLLIFPFLFLLLKKRNQNIAINKRVFFLIFSGFLLCTIAFVFWFIRFEPNAQITKGVIGLLQHTPTYLVKVNRIGNLLAAVGNIFIGLIYSMRQDFQDTGFYSRIFGFTGLLVFTVSLGCFLYFLKNSNKKKYGMAGFFILWAFLFYLPNWFSEPRAPMAGPHRYVFLSSIGFIFLIAYLFISFLKNKKLLIILSVVFILLNIWKANTILAWQSSYRSQAVIDKIWGEIDKTVPKGEKHAIFIFTGDQPWLSQTVGLFGADRFMLMRGYTKLSDAPVILSWEEVDMYNVCNAKIQKPKLNMYLWQILKDSIEKKSFIYNCS